MKSKGAFAQIVNPINNGFSLVTRADLEGHCYISMEAVESMRALFAAIVVMSRSQSAKEIEDLAKHGGNIAELLDNDIDVIRERAVKAGLMGYLVPKEGVDHE